MHSDREDCDLMLKSVKWGVQRASFIIGTGSSHQGSCKRHLCSCALATLDSWVWMCLLLGAFLGISPAEEEKHNCKVNAEVFDDIWLQVLLYQISLPQKDQKDQKILAESQHELWWIIFNNVEYMCIFLMIHQMSLFSPQNTEYNTYLKKGEYEMKWTNDMLPAHFMLPSRL